MMTYSHQKPKKKQLDEHAKSGRTGTHSKCARCEDALDDSPNDGRHEGPEAFGKGAIEEEAVVEVDTVPDDVAHPKRNSDSREEQDEKDDAAFRPRLRAPGWSGDEVGEDAEQEPVDYEVGAVAGQNWGNQRGGLPLS